MNYNNIDILLVDDNNNDAELTIRHLKKLKLSNKLIHVQDGEEALDFIFCTGQFKDRQATENRLKLILLDIHMPKLNGLQVLKIIKSHDRTNMIPVVMLTSSKEDPDIQRSYDLGANNYIVKPVNFEGLAEAIKNLGFYWLLLNHPPI